MKVYLKNRMDIEYTDITEYVNLPIMINDTVDGSYITTTIICRFPSDFEMFDVSKPISPKWLLKIVDGDEEIELENTYHFITTDQSSVSLRKEVLDQQGEVAVPSLYEHKINGNEPLYWLEGKYAPSYTITQPKTEYFDVYRKSGGARFNINHSFSQDGLPKTLPQGTKVELAGSYNNGAERVISTGYENGKHYIELENVNDKTFKIDVSVNLQKTLGYIEYKRIFTFKAKIKSGYEIAKISTISNQTLLKTEIQYYDINNNIINEQENIKTMSYLGGEMQGDWGILPTQKIIKGFSEINEFSHTITVEKSTLANKVRVYFSVIANDEYGVHENQRIPTNISGLPNDTQTKTHIQELKLFATSSAYENPQVEQKSTLYEFVNKAIHDYNLNSRDKIILDPELETVLGVVAKESEWVDYNYKELVERVFRYVGYRPYLTHDFVLTYRREQKVAYDIELESQNDNQSEQVGDYFYDKVISSSKNLVSEKDFVREIIPISSVDTEFSQMRDDTIGFLTSNDIYFVSNAILYAPNIEFVFKDLRDNSFVTVKSNIDKDNYWNITSRLFEEDIYNSFPNVRLDVKAGQNSELKQYIRSDPNLYSRTNTISYKSGGNTVDNIGHLGEKIPTYSWISLLTNAPDYFIAEYAIVELLLVLAYGQLTDEENYEWEDFKVNEPNITLPDLQDLQLDITYAPIYKELTTKHVSNMSDRRGLGFEKKFNMTDRVISYDESAKILRNEMERKGNVKHLYTEKVRNLNETIPVNSIVNNNYYITSKTITIDNKLITTDYILQKNFVLQNEDIRLPVEFDRYHVPYEYVNREVMIDNHLLFSTTPAERYLNGEEAVSGDFIKETILGRTYNPLKERRLIYGLAELDYNDGDPKKYLLRIGKIETDFTLMLTGRFMDNYTAGVQRYAGEGEYVYSQPLRYTDPYGKSSEIKRFKIGWSSNSSNGLVKSDQNKYDLKSFPDGSDVGNFNHVLVDLDETLLVDKDAREGVSFAHTSYLESLDDDIKFYSFKPITHVGILTNPIEFSDDLNYEKVEKVLTELGEVLVSDFVDNGGEFEITLNIGEYDVRALENGLVLYNDDGDKTLVGLIKNFEQVDNNKVKFYIYTTRYGYQLDNWIRIAFRQRVYISGVVEYRHVKDFGYQLIKGNQKIRTFSSYAMKQGNYQDELALGQVEVLGDIDYDINKSISQKHVVVGDVEVIPNINYIVGLAIVAEFPVIGEQDIIPIARYFLNKGFLLEVGAINKYDIKPKISYLFGYKIKLDYLLLGEVESVGELDYNLNYGKLGEHNLIKTVNTLGVISYNKLERIKLDFEVFANNNTIGELNYIHKDGDNLTFNLREQDKISGYVGIKHSKKTGILLNVIGLNKTNGYSDYSINQGSFIEGDRLGSLKSNPYINYELGKRTYKNYGELSVKDRIEPSISYAQNRGKRIGSNTLLNSRINARINYKQIFNQDYIVEGLNTILGFTIYVISQGIKITTSFIDSLSITPRISYDINMRILKQQSAIGSISIDKSISYKTTQFKGIELETSGEVNIEPVVSYVKQDGDNLIYTLGTKDKITPQIIYKFEKKEIKSYQFKGTNKSTQNIDYVMAKKTYNNVGNILGNIGSNPYISYRHRQGKKIVSTTAMNVRSLPTISYTNIKLKGYTMLALGDVKIDKFISYSLTKGKGITQSAIGNVAIDEIIRYNMYKGSKKSYLSSGKVSIDKFISYTHTKDEKKELRWAYDQPAFGLATILGYNPIGTTCNVEGETRLVTAIDIGYPHGQTGTHRIKCIKV